MENNVISPSEERTIGQLDRWVAALPQADRERFERIFCVGASRGVVVPPQPMQGWIAERFGSVEAVEEQRIVRVTNRVTLEGSLFNELRAKRPIELPAKNQDVEAIIAASAGGPFCQAEGGTPADLFGRVQGKFCRTASNVAKYDGWHSVIVFDEHHPLRFSQAQVADYVETAQAWAHEAHRLDPEARYPFFLWNCLWRSGASILHGHAQMALTRGLHYATVEAWRRSSVAYRAAHGASYFDDLVAVHRSLGLAVAHGSAWILPSLTPFKEKETLVLGSRLDSDLKAALYRVLRCLVDRLGVQSFNLGLYQPPLAPVAEDWEGFPFVFRIVDRGSLHGTTSDVGSMEIFAQSIISTDPFLVASALRD